MYQLVDPILGSSSVNNMQESRDSNLESAGEDKLVQCESCHKQFGKNEMKLLEQHVNHNQCTWCKSTFGCNKKLQFHKSFNCSAVNAEGGKMPIQKCRKCAKTFMNHTGLRNHYSSNLVCNVVSSGKFKCELCHMRFYGLGNLSVHQVLKYCKSCYMDFHCTGLMRQHKKEGCSSRVEGGDESMLTCKRCSKFYKSAEGHFRMLHSTCKYCKKVFQCKGFCENHEQTCTQDLTKKCANEEDNCEGEEEMDQDAGGHQNLRSKIRPGLGLHSPLGEIIAGGRPCSAAQSTSPHKTNVKLSRFPLGKAPVHQMASQPLSKIPQPNLKNSALITCKLCNESYRSVKCHFRTNYKSCKICRQNFGCRILCKRHEKSCVIVPKQDCEKEQSIEQKMEESVDNYEADEPREVPLKVRKCAHCDFRCASEETFQNHTRPTKCPRCEFLQPCNKILALHLDSCAFGAAAEPAFKCPLCGQGFAEAALLGSHVGTCAPSGSMRMENKEFKCKECGKVFHKKGKLRTHEERRHLVQKLKNEISMLAEDNRKFKKVFFGTESSGIVKNEFQIIELDD